MAEWKLFTKSREWKALRYELEQRVEFLRGILANGPDKEPGWSDEMVRGRLRENEYYLSIPVHTVNYLEQEEKDKQTKQEIQELIQKEKELSRVSAQDYANKKGR